MEKSLPRAPFISQGDCEKSVCEEIGPFWLILNIQSAGTGNRPSVAMDLARLRTAPRCRAGVAIDCRVWCWPLNCRPHHLEGSVWWSLAAPVTLARSAPAPPSPLRLHRRPAGARPKRCTFDWRRSASTALPEQCWPPRTEGIEPGKCVPTSLAASARLPARTSYKNCGEETNRLGVVMIMFKKIFPLPLTPALVILGHGSRVGGARRKTRTGDSQCQRLSPSPARSSCPRLLPQAETTGSPSKVPFRSLYEFTNKQRQKSTSSYKTSPQRVYSASATLKWAAMSLNPWITSSLN